MNVLLVSFFLWLTLADWLWSWPHTSTFTCSLRDCTQVTFCTCVEDPRAFVVEIAYRSNHWTVDRWWLGTLFCRRERERVIVYFYLGGGGVLWVGVLGGGGYAYKEEAWRNCSSTTTAQPHGPDIYYSSHAELAHATLIVGTNSRTHTSIDKAYLNFELVSRWSTTLTLTNWYWVCPCGWSLTYSVILSFQRVAFIAAVDGFTSPAAETIAYCHISILWSRWLGANDICNHQNNSVCC